MAILQLSPPDAPPTAPAAAPAAAGSINKHAPVSHADCACDARITFRAAARGGGTGAAGAERSKIVSTSRSFEQVEVPRRMVSRPAPSPA